MSEDYDVGYGKPPKQTQFKPGHSGNPKGRPKGVKNLNTDLGEELAQQVLVTEGGTQTQITKQRAIIKALIAKALQGNVPASNALINLISVLEQQRAVEEVEEIMSADDEAILEQFITTKLQGTGKSGSEQDSP